MKIKDILKTKGFEVIAVESSVTINVAVNKMVERNIGAVLVVDEGKPVGLFTERDALRCWSSPRCEAGRMQEADFSKIHIKDVMTKDIFIATPDDDLNYAMAIMIEKNIRHLPIVDQGKVVSMVSIRDIVKLQLSSLETEIHYLKDYITGEYSGR